ncbi:MAG: hypothetical protein GY714_23760 [Desulfobacterales bacterium]|nr:hypothetical protein [Desulfobacterales bacterium]MCP4161805.1 hypothetical protein [Deltaproteobacteria bacterium]
MNSKKLKTYNKNFKEQILKECIETNNYSAVAKKHKLLGRIISVICSKSYIFNKVLSYLSI